MAELETATYVSFPSQGTSVILPVNFLFLLFLESGNNHLLRFSCLFLQTLFFFFFSGLSNNFTGKSNHHCHMSAYEKSFPIKPVSSPSWSGACRRNLLSPKKTQRRHISTAEEVRKSC